jgi:transcriptional regulator with XRE-family HTH domain
MVFAIGEMSPCRPRRRADERLLTAMRRFASTIGAAFYEERHRRRRTLRDVGDAAGVSASVVHDAEAGRLVSLESYLRVADALGIRFEASLTPIRRRDAERATGDLVHAAMAEAQARHFRDLGYLVAIDTSTTSSPVGPTCSRGTSRTPRSCTSRTGHASRTWARRSGASTRSGPTSPIRSGSGSAFVVGEA